VHGIYFEQERSNTANGNSFYALSSFPSLQVTELLHLGADIECRDKEGYTPVHFAAARGRLDILSLLWSKSADIDAETPSAFYYLLL